LVEEIGVTKPLAMALITPAVVLAVWLAVRRIRRSML
jgi:uncharacterized membrane-anchored protein